MSKNYKLYEILVILGFASNEDEAKSLISNNKVQVSGVIINDENYEISALDFNSHLLINVSNNFEETILSKQANYLMSPENLVPNIDEFIELPFSHFEDEVYISSPADLLPDEAELINGDSVISYAPGRKNNLIAIAIALVIVTLQSFLFYSYFKYINNSIVELIDEYQDINFTSENIFENMPEYEDLKDLEKESDFIDYINSGEYKDFDANKVKLLFNSYFISDSRLEADPSEDTYVVKKINLNDTTNSNLDYFINVKIKNTDSINNLSKVELYILNIFQNPDLLNDEQLIDLLNDSYIFIDPDSYEINIKASGEFRKKLSKIIKISRISKSHGNKEWNYILYDFLMLSSKLDNIIEDDINNNKSFSEYKDLLDESNLDGDLVLDYRINILNPYNYKLKLASINNEDIIYDFYDDNLKDSDVESYGTIGVSDVFSENYNDSLDKFFNYVFTAQGNEFLNNIANEDAIDVNDEIIFQALNILKSNYKVKALEYEGAKYILSFDPLPTDYGEDYIQIDYIEDFPERIHYSQRYLVNIKTGQILIYDVIVGEWVDIDHFGNNNTIEDSIDDQQYYGVKADSYYADERYEYNVDSEIKGSYTVTYGTYYVYESPDINSTILYSLEEGEEFFIFNDFVDEYGNLWGNIGGHEWILFE